MGNTSYKTRCGFTPLEKEFRPLGGPPFGVVKNTWRGGDFKPHPRFLTGFSMVELVVTIIVTVVLIPVVGVLLIGGHRAWSTTYLSAHKKIKQDAQTVTLTFGSIGRTANRNSMRQHENPISDFGYAIYNINGSSFTKVIHQGTGALEIVSGEAVEFRYWNVELDPDDSQGLMDNTKIATAYALFYIDGDKLMLDRGPYPPGAVPVDGGSKNTNGVITSTLAENVSFDPDIGAFSYTVLNNTKRGAVRIHITLTDPVDGESIKVMTTTLLRNDWPR